MRMNRFGLLVGLLVAAMAPTASASPVFFSEYVEGSSGSDKALEIYNGNAAPLDLAGWQVRLYLNGSPTPTSSIDLTGTVGGYDVYVIASGTIQGDLTAALTFTGDDAVELRDGTAGVVDVIGQIGNDPGSAWGTSPTTTENATLRRKTAVSQGDVAGGDAFDPAVEWDGQAVTFSGLGQHGTDTDVDGVPDLLDNCPAIANPGQENADGDSQGNPCDPDDDNDSVDDAGDNCPLATNPGQENADGDTEGNSCDPDDDNDTVVDAMDNCPLDHNFGQENADGDPLGNACDPDDDNDGVADSTDACPTVGAATSDGCSAPTPAPGPEPQPAATIAPAATPTSGAVAPTDRTPPALVVTGRRTQRAARVVTLNVRAAAEPRRIGASSTVAFGSSRHALPALVPRLLRARSALTLRVVLSRRELTAVRAALRRRQRVTVQVTVTASDSAGNVRSAVHRIRLR